MLSIVLRFLWKGKCSSDSSDPRQFLHSPWNAASQWLQCGWGRVCGLEKGKTFLPTAGRRSQVSILKSHLDSEILLDYHLHLQNISPSTHIRLILDSGCLIFHTFFAFLLSSVVMLTTVQV